MRTLLYIMSFVLLDAIVPRSCRPDSSIEKYNYEYEYDEEYDEFLNDSLDTEDDEIPSDSLKTKDK